MLKKLMMGAVQALVATACISWSRDAVPESDSEASQPRFLDPCHMSVLQGRHATTSGCPYSELFMNQDYDETRHVAMEDSYEDFFTDRQEIAYNLGGWLVTLKYMMKTGDPTS